MDVLFCNCSVSTEAKMHWTSHGLFSRLVILNEDIPYQRTEVECLLKKAEKAVTCSCGSLRTLCWENEELPIGIFHWSESWNLYGIDWHWGNDASISHGKPDSLDIMESNGMEGVNCNMSLLLLLWSNVMSTTRLSRPMELPVVDGCKSWRQRLIWRDG